MDNGCSVRNYVTRVVTDPSLLNAEAWDGLLARQPGGAASGPFMRHAYLAALHTSGSAVPATGWAPQWMTLWQGGELHAAAPDPKTIRWYTAGHNLNQQAVNDRDDWLVERIGLD